MKIYIDDDPEMVSSTGKSGQRGRFLIGKSAPRVGVGGQNFLRIDTVWGNGCISGNVAREDKDT